MMALSAFTGLITATALNELALTRLAEVVSQLSTMILLSSFMLIILLGMGLMAKLIFTSFAGYFSTHRRYERRVLFYLNKRNRLERLYKYKKRRVLYYNQLHRKRLLRESDEKSVAL